MNPAAYLKPALCVVMVLLTGIYIYLNQAKLDIFFAGQAQFVQGKSAPLARITVDGKSVWEKPLLSTGFFDSSGKMQVHYITLAPTLIQALMQKGRDIKFFIDDAEPVHPQIDEKLHVARADLSSHRIYFIPADRLDVLAMAILSESHGVRDNVQCFPETLCQGIRISSQEWGVVEGPYLGTDNSILRRGMPRGRWMAAPKTTLSIKSAGQQSIVMLLNLYGLMSDQQIAISGAGVRKVEQPRISAPPMKGGVWDLYPHSILVMMELQKGDNELVIRYSKWPEPLREGGVPLAAYLSAIKIKPLTAGDDR